MKKIIQYLLAYISGVIVLLLMFLSILKLFNIIDFEGKLLFLIIIFGTIYQKYTPENFKILKKLIINKFRGQD